MGGFNGNSVAAGAVGAAIGGGGASGNTNRVTDDFGTVGGGFNNRAGDNAGTTFGKPYPTVGGGVNNTASGNRSTIGGGSGNTAIGLVSTVGGGEGNTASGEFAAVPGGFLNTAQGDFSFAAGTHAKANHAGAFVWADSTFADFTSTANNQFLIRAAGGVGIGTAAPAAVLQVRDNPVIPGVTFFSGTGAMFNAATNNVGFSGAPTETVMVLAREGISGQSFANFARFDLKRWAVVDTGSHTQMDIRLSDGDLAWHDLNRKGKVEADACLFFVL